MGSTWLVVVSSRIAAGISSWHEIELPEAPADIRSRIHGGDRAFLYRLGIASGVVGIGTIAELVDGLFCWNVELLGRPRELDRATLREDPVLGPVLETIDDEIRWYHLAPLASARLEILSRGISAGRSDEDADESPHAGRASCMAQRQRRGRPRGTGLSIRAVDPGLLDKPVKSGAKRSSRAVARLARQQKFMEIISRINDEADVFEIRDDPAVKPAAIRLWLLKAAEAVGRQVVVRRSDGGWLVGLATQQRRSRRGRPRRQPQP